jgi:ubiquinone/menaquinone biosynthesis C-methylase UbiE
MNSAASLREARVLREKEAYNDGAVQERSYRLAHRFIHVFESANTNFGEEFFNKTLQRVCPDSTVLDYGCLDGYMTVRYLRFGAAKVIGIDICDRAVAKAGERFRERAEFHVCDAHRISILPAESVDVVVGRGILHHLEFDTAMLEVRRVLRKNGTAIFVEPLFGSPASVLFRKLTPKTRTEDERPLTRQQIEWADGLFASRDHRFCNLLTTPLAMITSLLPVRADNRALRVADWIDRHLARTKLRFWMRAGYFTWIK